MNKRKAVILTMEEWDRLILILDQPRFYDPDIIHLLQRLNGQINTVETQFIPDPENPNRLKAVEKLSLLEK